MADSKLMPDISGVKSKDVNSVVVVQILVGTEGDVGCARIEQGDSDLAQRSIDAAQKWHYKPFLLNGEKINVETRIRFSYRKNNVKVILPDR